jgi:hypothetical protein
MSSEVSFRTPEWHEIVDLAGRLKESDVAEIDAAYAMEPLDAITSLRGSDVTGAYIDGRLEVIYGVNAADYDANMAAVWMLSSDVLHRHAKRLIRLGRQWLDEQQARHGVLFNFVDARAVRTLSWLRRMGFSFTDVPQYGARGLPFILIMRGA